MTSTTPSPSKRRLRRAFTLVELMMTMGIGSIVMAGVVTSFLFLGRTGTNLNNYAAMEAQGRKGLELFAEDTRQASAVVWNSANSVTLTVDGSSVIYTYDSSTSKFTRTIGGSSSDIITGITTFALKGYTTTGVDVSTANDLSTASGRTSAANITKQLQISMRISRNSTTVATATDTVLSARFTLRNKRTTA